MAFWDSFSWVSSTSPITTLLEKEETTLENILDEDQILNELRGTNKTLLDYLSKPEILLHVIDLITKPVPDLDESLQYRYPYLCSEILCFDTPGIQDTLLTDECLDRLFSFLDGATPLNSLLSNYFNRVVGNILAKKAEIVVEFLKKRESFLQQALVHIYNNAVSEVLMKLLTCGKEEVVDEWFAEEEFISKLVAKMDPEEDLATHENAATILLCICTNSFQVINGGQGDPKLFGQINNEETLSHLVDLMFKKSASSSLTQGSVILVQLCREQQGNIEPNTAVESLPAAHRVLLQALPKIKETLQTSTEASFKTTCGELKTPFGFYRMSALELFQALLGCKAMCVFKQVLESEIFAVIIDLFFEFQWNNFLHNCVLECVEAILNSHEDDIILPFIKQTDLHEKIGQSGETPNINGEESSRKGFMGHLGKLASDLHTASEVSDKLGEILQNNQPWKKYLQEDFASIKKVEAAKLGSAEAEEDVDVDQTVNQFHDTIKRRFEDDFPDSFTRSNEDLFDILIRPTDNQLYVGINTDETGFGSEFDDDDNFMGSDDEEDEDY